MNAPLFRTTLTRPVGPVNPAEPRTFVLYDDGSGILALYSPDADGSKYRKLVDRAVIDAMLDAAVPGSARTLLVDLVERGVTAAAVANLIGGGTTPIEPPPDVAPGIIPSAAVIAAIDAATFYAGQVPESTALYALMTNKASFRSTIQGRAITTLTFSLAGVASKSTPIPAGADVTFSVNLIDAEGYSETFAATATASVVRPDINRANLAHTWPDYAPVGSTYSDTFRSGGANFSYTLTKGTADIVVAKPKILTDGTPATGETLTLRPAVLGLDSGAGVVTQAYALKRGTTTVKSGVIVAAEATWPTYVAVAADEGQALVFTCTPTVDGVARTPLASDPVTVGAAQAGGGGGGGGTTTPPPAPTNLLRFNDPSVAGFGTSSVAIDGAGDIVMTRPETGGAFVKRNVGSGLAPSTNYRVTMRAVSAGRYTVAFVMPMSANSQNAGTGAITFDSADTPGEKIISHTFTTAATLTAGTNTQLNLARPTVPGDTLRITSFEVVAV